LSFILALFALCLLAAVLQDAFEVMLLPRRVYRRLRLTRWFFRAFWSGWCAIADRIRDETKRERFMSVFGALSMMVLFAVWAGALITGFGILEWVAEGAKSFSDELYMSGVTFFTLGYGDIVPHSGIGRLVSVLEAGCGIGFIAIVIGYLPVLYQLFARREAHVIQLDARAGTPPSAVTMLIRHAECDGLDRLEDLLREWEVWASDLLESHLSYPMLVYYRSQHENQSWLSALAAIMDCCALILAGVENMRPLQARMTFAMARHVIVELARSFDIAPSRYTGGDRLPASAYLKMEQMLRDAGVEWDSSPQTEEALAGLRATYEPLLDGLRLALRLPLPEWMPSAETNDHWQRGHRGTIARRLVEQLSNRVDPEATVTGDGSLSRRLRARLSRD
jgi:hypothetical protein